MTKNDAKKQSVTDRQTDRQTNRPTDRPTDLGIKAPSRSLKKQNF